MYVLALRDQNKEYVGRDIDEVEIYAIKSNFFLLFKIISHSLFLLWLLLQSVEEVR